jgi:hypothetical protein
MLVKPERSQQLLVEPKVTDIQHRPVTGRNGAFLLSNYAFKYGIVPRC